LEKDVEERLEQFDVLLCSPGSPYQSMRGALNGVQFAREFDRPFLGTCGGFQHVVIEYARNVMEFADAQHAEYDPHASRLFITPLSCSLVGKTMKVRVIPGSRASDAYGRTEVEEQYHCNFDLNPDYKKAVDEAGLRTSGMDEDGEVRILELPDRRFFIATPFCAPTDLIGGSAASNNRFPLEGRSKGQGCEIASLGSNPGRSKPGRCRPPKSFKPPNSPAGNGRMATATRKAIP
jgi:CTP synthase (UTP-ammonia lyase)